MGSGTVELVGDLRANLATLQAEGHDVSVDRNVPTKFDVFDDDIMLRTGAWDQITLWSGGTGFSRQLCETVLASTCAIFAKHEALLHPNGEVKFSHMVGGSTVTPHCGPQDTKIRMHYMVVRWLWLWLWLWVLLMRRHAPTAALARWTRSLPSLSICFSLSLSPPRPPPHHPARAHTGCGWRACLCSTPTGTFFLSL